MNTKLLPLLALVALPGLAETPWQVGLTLDQASFRKINYQGTLPFAGIPIPVTADTSIDNNTGLGLEVGYRAWDFGSSDLGFTGAYRFKSRSDARINITAAGVTLPPIKSKAGYSFASAGVQWNYHSKVNFGFGLQVRFERLADDDPEPGETSVTASYARPWANGYVGYTFEAMGGVRPFVALNTAVALSKSAPPDRIDLTDDQNIRDLLKAMGPVLAVGIQAGVRF